MKKMLILILGLIIFSFSFSISKWDYYERFESSGRRRTAFIGFKDKDAVAIGFDTTTDGSPLRLRFSTSDTFLRKDIGVDEGANISIIIDKSKAKEYKVANIFEGEMVVGLNQDEILEIAEEMKKGKEITAKVEGRSGEKVLKFPLEGFAEVYNKLSEVRKEYKK